jgi:hypothetical protein
MSSACTYPSANAAPRRFDLDLAFPTFWFGNLLKSQVLLAVESHGVHHFSRRHDDGVQSVSIVKCLIARCRVAGQCSHVKTRVILVKMYRKTALERLQSTLLYTIDERATSPHTVFAGPRSYLRQFHDCHALYRAALVRRV